MSLRKKYVLATIGKETGKVHRVSFMRFRTLKKAEWWKQRLNAKAGDSMVYWVVMELGH